MKTYKVIKKKTTYSDHISMDLKKVYDQLMDDDFVIINWIDEKQQKRIDCMRLLLPWDPKKSQVYKALSDYMIDLGFTKESFKSNRSKADYIVRINQISIEQLLMVTI